MAPTGSSLFEAQFLQRFKRILLLLLLGLTGWTAVLLAHGLHRGGPAADNLSWALGTILAQGFLILVSFAAFTALDHPKLRHMAAIGMMAAVLVLAFLPPFAWYQITDRVHLRPLQQLDHDHLTQLAATAFLSAGVLCLIPFILVPPMKRVGRIVQLTTILYMTFAYLCAVLYLWHIDRQRIEESLITLLVPAGACMMGVFALHKFFKIHPPDPLTSVAPTLQVRCPRCQCAQALALGESRCCRCRLRFFIAVEEPRCPNCHFNLHQLTRPVCPECGFQLDAEDVPALETPAALPAAKAGPATIART